MVVRSRSNKGRDIVLSSVHKPKLKNRLTGHGEVFLSEVETITVKLENGALLAVVPSAELTIPDGLHEQFEEARKAPARLAFWGWQMERQLYEVRKFEAELAALEGETSLTYRQWYKEHLFEEYTEGVIRAHVDYDPKVKSAKIRLNYARKCYGYLRALHEALSHRLFVLRKLVAQEPDAK